MGNNQCCSGDRKLAEVNGGKTIKKQVQDFHRFNDQRINSEYLNLEEGGLTVKAIKNGKEQSNVIQSKEAIGQGGVHVFRVKLDEQNNWHSKKAYVGISRQPDNSNDKIDTNSYESVWIQCHDGMMYWGGGNLNHYASKVAPGSTL